MESYCLKCEGPREIVYGEGVTMKNGRSAYRGRCQECDGVLFRIVKKEALLGVTGAMRNSGNGTG